MDSKNELIIEKKENIKIKLNPSKLEELYSITASTPFMKFKEASRKSDDKILNRQEFADEIRDLLGYTGEATLIINFSWKCEICDVTSYWVREAYLFIEDKKENK